MSSSTSLINSRLDSSNVCIGGSSKVLGLKINQDEKEIIGVPKLGNDVDSHSNSRGVDGFVSMVQPVVRPRLVCGGAVSKGHSEDTDKCRPPLRAQGNNPSVIYVSVVEGKAVKRKTPSGYIDRKEEEVEEFYGQLWVIPSPSRRQPNHKHRPPPPNPRSAIGSHLFWIKKNLLRSGCFSAEDCHPIIHPSRFDPIPTRFRICEEGGARRASFASVVKGIMDPRGQQRPKKNPPKKGGQGVLPPPPGAPVAKGAVAVPKQSSNTGKSAQLFKMQSLLQPQTQFQFLLCKP